MKILITGDISNRNIENFSVEKVDPKYLNLIKQQDLVIYNLEGPIINPRQYQKNLQFRENKFQNFLITSLNTLSSKIFNKKQRYVYSTEKIIPLLKLNKNTLVTLANNHIKDYGKNAFKNTLKVLGNNNIDYIGVGSNLQECKDFEVNSIVFININLVGVKKLGVPFHLYSATNNGFGANYKTYNKLSQKIKRYKDKDKKVILIIHGGKELAENESQLGLDLEKINQLNADLTVIHHPHVYVKTKYEKNNIYVLGDFIFHSQDNRLKQNRQSALLSVNFENNKFYPKLNKFKVKEIYE
ncbi:MAG: CapA family protein [Patescibacteria group bacterium]|nr:CapA family protein [Patescibacteria group bacterium]